VVVGAISRYRYHRVGGRPGAAQMITYTNIGAGDQVVRRWWRVTLKGDVLDLGYLISNPLEKWGAKVDRWRSAVNDGKLQVVAAASPAAATDNEVLLYARAVVDVHILGGAEVGESVSKIASRMNSLITSIDVKEVEGIANEDPIGRAAALNDANADAHSPNVFDRFADQIESVIKLAIIIGVVYVGVTLYKASKSK